MLFFIPWVLLFVAVIIAVPVAQKLAPGPSVGGGAADPEMGDYSDGMIDESSVIDDFGGGAEPAEPLGDDAFADFQ